MERELISVCLSTAHPHLWTIIIFHYSTSIILKNIHFFHKRCNSTFEIANGNEHTLFHCCHAVTWLIWCCGMNWADGCSKMNFWGQILLLTFSRNIWWQRNGCLLLRALWQVPGMGREFTAVLWGSIPTPLVSEGKRVQGFQGAAETSVVLELLTDPLG